MAGTLTISTLSDGTNSTSSTNCIQGSAKAWVNFNGNPTSIRASYNTSSVTRNANGNYTIAFTNAFSDTNYATVFGNNGYAGYGSPSYPEYLSIGTKATTSIQIYAGSPVSGGNTAWGASDASEINLAVFR